MLEPLITLANSSGWVPLKLETAEFVFGIGKRLEKYPNFKLRTSTAGISERMRKLLGNLEVVYSAPNTMGLLEIRIASRDH